MAKIELNTAFGASDKYNVQKILATKTVNPKAMTNEMCQLISKPNKKHKPDKPIKIDNGGETVIKPNKNVFQFRPNRPLSTKPVEFGKF